MLRRASYDHRRRAGSETGTRGDRLAPMSAEVSVRELAFFFESVAY